MSTDDVRPSEIIELLQKDKSDDDNDLSSEMIVKTKDITWSQIVGGSVGNILEWYDFAVFGFLASEIGLNFFPETNDPIIQLMKAYGIFAGAFVARPIGGVIFGILGDRKGRKYALQLSMQLMFVSTFVMGCLPTQSVIGIWSPIILSILRIFQGLSVGGQLIGSILFIVESARKDKRGFYGGLVMMTSGIGGMMGSFVVSMMYLVFTKQEMIDYAWRLPFLSSFVIGIIGLFSQKHMPKSHEFSDAHKQNKVLANPLQYAISHYCSEIIFIAVTVIPWCACGYMTYNWLPTYLENHVKVEHAMTCNTVSLLCKLPFTAFGGYLSDIYGYYTTMKWGAIILTFCAFPCYMWINDHFIIEKKQEIWPLFFVDLIMSFGLGLFGGPMQIMMVMCVDDVVVRYCVMGIAYNLCQLGFGGTAPIIGSALSMINLSYVGLYLSAFSAISVVCLHQKEQQTKKQAKP